jgi:phenylacetate-CoA ligase
MVAPHQKKTSGRGGSVEMNYLLDVARGAYSRLPPNTRSALASILRFVPEDLKWGRTYRQWRQLLAAVRTNPALVHDLQERARLSIVCAAAQNSRYYRELFDGLFGQTSDIGRMIEDANWRRIPVLTSETVVSHGRAICSRPPEELDTASTGGSSGKPVTFFLDRNRSPIEYAFVHDAWSRAGFRAGDPRCVFRGFDLSDAGEQHMQYDPALAELRCSVFHMTDATMRGYADEIVRRGIRFIHGYPSAIAIFAAYLLRSGLGPWMQMAGIFPTSERFHADQHAVIAQAFVGATIVPIYGLSEKVAFARARSDGLDVYEFDPLYGYTELLDESGAPVVTTGAVGRIVSTGLLFPGMPLIRYDTKDSAQLVALPSTANGYRLTVCGLAPKHGGEYFLGRSGTLIAVKGIISNLQGTAYGIAEYQFYQDTVGEAVARIVPARGTADFSRYENLLNRKLAGELSVTVQVVDRIATTSRGKRKIIDQRLDLTEPLSTLRIGLQPAICDMADLSTAK